MNQRRAWRLIFIAMSMVAWVRAANAGVADCGSLDNAYGPYDYRDPSTLGKGGPRYLVDSAHFTIDVQTLAHGSTSDLPGSDLDYTLRAFPNHHAALYSMINYYTDALAKTRPPMRRSAECYFDRAIRFQPDDETVWMLYGVYLSRIDKIGDAIEKLKHAEELNPKAPEVHYNLGLMYIKAGNYDAALSEARIAYHAKYPLMGLKKELKEKGVWKEP